MNDFSFDSDLPINRVGLKIGEDGTLILSLTGGNISRTLILHDHIKKGKSKYVLFHEKTKIVRESDTSVAVMTPAAETETGRPISGLYAIYRFTFDKDCPAVCLSAELDSDGPLCGYSAHIGEISVVEPTLRYTGCDGEARITYDMPERTSDSLDMEALSKMTPHTAWEKLKTRPVSFRNGLSLDGSDGSVVFFGCAPTFNPEAGFVSLFKDLSAYPADLRDFSGNCALCAFIAVNASPDTFFSEYKPEIRLPSLGPRVFFTSEEERRNIECGKLSFDLIKVPGGICASAVCAKKPSGAIQPSPLFTLELYDTTYSRNVYLDSSSGWNNVKLTEKDGYVKIVLSDPASVSPEKLTVVVEGFKDEKNSRISWKTRLVNLSSRMSSAKLSYPKCPLYGYKNVFLPVGSGMVNRNFNASSSAFSGRYPLGVKVNMPFFAFYNDDETKDGKTFNGFYVGIHDAEGTPKTVYACGAPASDCSNFGFVHSAACSGKAGNSFELPGEEIWALFSGDWYDAAMIYRSFVHSACPWLSKLRGRSDSPDWLKESPVWIMHFLPNENPDAPPFPVTLREKYPDTSPDDWFLTAVGFKEKLGLPVAYHLYNWHWIPFNNDNPNYFPAHHDLKRGVKALKEAGIKIVPYVAGYSWDMRDDRGESFRFETEALQNAAKKKDGSVVFKSYASVEPDGSAVKFARMCPTTAFWKSEVNNIASRLRNEYGADGVYLDVISAQYDECCDPTHLHPSGSGTFWRKGYEALAAYLKAEAPDDFAVVSESASEVYTGTFDGHLTWTWVREDQVPAFPAVYSGYTTLFGRVITQNERDDAGYFRFQTASSFVYGQQLGWIHPEIVNDAEQFGFLKKLARIRYEFREFFAEAEMLRPPKVSGSQTTFFEPFLRGTFRSREQNVVSGAFEDKNGNCALFIINSQRSQETVSLSIKEDEYGIAGEIETDSLSNGMKVVSSERKDGILKIGCILKPEGTGIIKWKRKI